MNSMDNTRKFLESIGLPGGDAYNLPTSEKRFAHGRQYRFEVPGIQGPKVMRALLEAMDSYGLYLHRVTQTQGIMRLTDEEIGKIIDIMLNQVVERLKTQKIEIEIEPEVKEMIAKKGIDKSFGARPLRRTIQSVLEDRLAEEILDGNLTKGKKKKIGIVDDKVAIVK